MSGLRRKSATPEEAAAEVAANPVRTKTRLPAYFTTDADGRIPDVVRLWGNHTYAISSASMMPGDLHFEPVLDSEVNRWRQIVNGIDEGPGGKNYAT